MIVDLVQPLTRPILSSLSDAITSVFSGFTPRSLFADGSIGVLYDNNDLTTMFVDAAGTTPATVNGLVGLQLDKSQGAALGADFCVNGGFDTDTVWTKGGGWAISGGVATKTPGVANTLQQAGSLTVGKAYKITYTVSGRTAGACAGALFGGTTVFEPLIGSNGARSCILIAVTGNITFGITADSTFDGSIDNFTIQELHGNHRYQTTTGSKPILRGTPTGSNLVTNGDFASGTGWTTGSFWAISGGTATKSAGGVGMLTSAFSDSVAGKVYRVEIDITSITPGSGNLTVRLTGGTSVIGSTYTTAGRKVEYIVGNGTNNAIAIVCNASDTLAVVESIDVRDVSAGSVTAPYGLQFDGVDDFLQTASVNFSATDKMFVCAGVRKLSDAAAGYPVNNGNGLVAGTFYLAVPASAAGPVALYARGSVEPGSTAVTANYPAPVTQVITCAADIAADSRTVRVNGAAAGSSASDLGTGTFANVPIYFGRLLGVSGPFNGLDFGFVIVGKTLTAAQISSTERWMAQRAGVSI